MIITGSLLLIGNNNVSIPVKRIFRESYSLRWHYYLLNVKKNQREILMIRLTFLINHSSRLDISYNWIYPIIW